MLSQLVATALIEFCLDSTFPSNVRKAMCLFICSDYKCVFFSHSRNSKDWHWINRQDTTKGWILCANVCVKNNQIYVLHFEMYTYEPDVDFKHLYILSIMLVYFFIFILDTLQSSPTVWNIMLDFYGFYPLLSAKTMNSVETHRRWRCLISHEFSAS